MSKIGLIDVGGHNFPNLALMELSSWRRREGGSVKWYSGIEHYGRVYMGEVFAFTPDDLRVIQADEVAKDGSGHEVHDQTLLNEVEHICPGYSLYPTCSNTYGFLTRGCVSQCNFCIVPRKGGFIRKHAGTARFLSGRQSATLMDNNIITSGWGLNQIEKITSLNVKVDFNQGLDCRIITKGKNIAYLLSHVKWKRFLRMAYDNSAITDGVTTTIVYLKEVGIPNYKLFFYMLVKNGQTEDVKKRALYLDSLGCIPFAMPYRNLDSSQPPANGQRHFARWVDKRSIFKSCIFESFRD